MVGITRSTTVKLSLLMAAVASVCFAQFIPSDSGSYAAKAVTLTGQVSVLRDLQPWALSAGDTVQVQQVIVTGIDGHAVFEVSDGSTFEVFPNSKVIFRKNPPTWRDLLDILVGKVRIQIQHLGLTPNPNRILTPTAVISVRGTIFDVTVDDDDETTLIEVEDGSVQVEHALLPTGTPSVVNAGEQIRVYKDVPIARRADKGNIIRQVLRIAVDAAVIAGRSGSSPGGSLPTGGGGGGGGVGDTGGGKTPPSGPPPGPLPPLP
jgi:hypothetical protein